MYRLSIKDSAIDASDAVADLVAEDGRVLEFESKQEAEDLAERLSSDAPRVRVQAVAPQDPNDVDGYLIKFPRRYVSKPKDSDTAGLTFDVGANQYGDLGQALVCGPSGLSPGIRYFVFDELDGIEEASHRLRGVAEPYLPDDLQADVLWSPDSLIQVWSRGEVVEQYFCEVKTGDASFERNQVRDMEWVASEYGVLKIRVIIEGLPEQYTIRVREVTPE